LSGGGARGLAHVGVLKILQQTGIPIDVICGASMGALIGGVYAQNPSADLLEKRVTEFIKGAKFKRLGVNNFRQKTRRDPDDIISQMTKRVQRRLIINLAANRVALLKSTRLDIAVEELVEDHFIEDTKIPFACSAADLLSGREVIFRKGKIIPAIKGSSAIPGFIPPVKYDGHLLIDGSVVNNFPVKIARELGAEYIIAIDVSLDFEQESDVENVIDLVMRSAQMTSFKLNTILKNSADYIIRPDIGKIHWSEFTRVDELIRVGEEAAKTAVSTIQKQIRLSSGLFKHIFKRTTIDKNLL